MEVNKEELRRLAEATGGIRWVASHATSHQGSRSSRSIYHYPTPYHCVEIVETPDSDPENGECIHDESSWAFIAAANPAAILSLLDDNKALLDQVSALQSDANSWQSGYDKGREMGSKHRVGEVDQLRAENESLREELGGIKNVSTETTQAMRRLVMYARTSGGTAGPDHGLMDACEQAEKMLSLGGIGRAYMEGADAAMANERNANS